MRHGTSSLYAALDVTTGKVIGAPHSRHRAQEFLAFLKKIDAALSNSFGFGGINASLIFKRYGG